MSIDEAWTVREPRAFSWIADRLMQRVAASPAVESADFKVSRLVSSTVVVERILESNDRAEAALASINAVAVGGAFVFSPADRSVRMMLAHGVHEETLEYRTREFASNQIIGLIQAEGVADALAEGLSGTVANRAHPRAGPRSIPDDMLNVVRGFYSPHGTEPSRFASDSEMQNIFEHVENSLDFSAGGSEAGIAIEVAFGEGLTTLVELVTNRPHPQLGNGLGVFVNLPLDLDHRGVGAAALANALNLAQFSEGELVPAFGAWCVHEQHGGVIASVRFIPNAEFKAGRAADAALGAVAQATWADRYFHPQLPRRSALPAVMKREKLTDERNVVRWQ
jgi:hypothetical protein